METGQVTFFRNNVVKRIHVKEKDNGIVNRLNKTKVEKYPDLAEEKIARDRETRNELREVEKKRVCSYEGALDLLLILNTGYRGKAN